MKRIVQSVTQHGPAVVLYRDDIEEAIDILSKTCKTLDISDGRYEFESLDEFIQQRGTKPMKLTLTGSSPYVHLAVTFSYVLFVGNETAYFRINEILQRRRRVIGQLLPPALLYCASGIAFSLFIASYYQLLPVKHLWFFWTSIFLFLCGRVGSFASIGGMSSIVLSRKHETSTFWTRNFETLIVGACALLIGVALTKLTEYLLPGQ